MNGTTTQSSMMACDRSVTLTTDSLQGARVESRIWLREHYQGSFSVESTPQGVVITMDEPTMTKEQAQELCWRLASFLRYATGMAVDIRHSSQELVCQICSWTDAGRGFRLEVSIPLMDEP